MKKIVLLMLVFSMLAGALSSCAVNRRGAPQRTSSTKQTAQKTQSSVPTTEKVPSTSPVGSTTTEPSTKPGGSTAEPSPNPGGATNVPSDDMQSEIEKRAQEKDYLPDDLNFAWREFNSFSFKELYTFDASGTDSYGDMVTDSVYRRNIAVEERLNVMIDHVVSSTQKFTEFSEEVALFAAAGVPDLDAIFIMGNAAIQYNYTVDVFTEINNLKYISADAPWWRGEAMEEVSFNKNHRKYLIGDICLSTYTRAGTMLVNSTDYNSYFADEGIAGLYELVLDRKWTVAELKTRASQALSSPNYGDYIGLAVGHVEMTKALEYGFDVTRYSRDENGEVYLDYDVNRASIAADALIDLFATNGVSWKLNYYKARDFAEGRTLFQVSQLSDLLSQELHEMTDDYTVVPLPMLDSGQTEYTTNIQNSAQMVGVLKSVTDTDFASAVIEALCTESYRTVVLPFFETALKIRYARDRGIGKMIDIINDTATKNYLYEYLPGDGCGALITNVVLMGSNEISSEYETAAAYTNENLELLKAFLNSQIPPLDGK